MIQIISETPVNEERIKETIRKEFGRQKDDIRFALKRLMFKLICLAILGAAILSVWLYLSATSESVGIEILSIMGWVCVWEATSIAVLQRPDLQRLRINMEHLIRAEIRIQVAEEPEENAAD